MIIGFERGLSDAKRWFRHSNICIRNLFGKTVGMARTVPANPRTVDQTASRDSMKAAGQGWRALSETDRAKWIDYARRFGSLISNQRYKDLSGWEVFLPAWRNRVLLGESPAVVPSDVAPPASVDAVEELFSGDEQTYSFRITHNAVPAGHVLLVRMTPQTATRSRKPYANQARMIHGHCRDSALPLPASGGIVTFTGARFTVEKGQRFGLALRIVRTEDGIHSREFFADLYRGGEEESETAGQAPDAGLTHEGEPVSGTAAPTVESEGSASNGGENPVVSGSASPVVFSLFRERSTPNGYAAPKFQAATTGLLMRSPAREGADNAFGSCGRGLQSAFVRL